MELRVEFVIDKSSIIDIYVELGPLDILRINCKRNIHKTKFTKDLVIRYLKRNDYYAETYHFESYSYGPSFTDPNNIILSFGDLKQALVKKNYTRWKQIEKIIFNDKSTVALPQKNSGFIDPHKYWKKK